MDFWKTLARPPMGPRILCIAYGIVLSRNQKKNDPKRSSTAGASPPHEPPKRGSRGGVPVLEPPPRNPPPEVPGGGSRVHFAGTPPLNRGSSTGTPPLPAKWTSMTFCPKVPKIIPDGFLGVYCFIYGWKQGGNGLIFFDFSSWGV